MSSTNEKIDRHLRQQIIRRVLLFGIIAAIFFSFMTYALWVEYGPDAEVVDIFPEFNDQGPVEQ